MKLTNSKILLRLTTARHSSQPQKYPQRYLLNAYNDAEFEARKSMFRAGFWWNVWLILLFGVLLPLSYQRFRLPLVYDFWNWLLLGTFVAVLLLDLFDGMRT
jgi:hypothetical protein